MRSEKLRARDVPSRHDHNTTYRLLHKANLIITVNDDRTLHVAKDREDEPRDVTPDEALTLVNKYIAWAEKHA